MPVWQVDDNPRSVGQYDVCAQFGNVEDLLVHALLCDEPAERDLDSGDATVRMVQMGPPLRTSISRADVVGTAALSEADRRQIKTFVDRRVLERKAHLQRLKSLGEKADARTEYIICPAGKRPDADFPLWRFSCAGFVIHAYDEAGIVLLADEVPTVGLTELNEAYSWAASYLSDPDFRKQMGIGDGDEWPVIFVGYVIQSLNRDPDEIRAVPYRSTPGDRFFPSRSGG